MNVSLRSSDWKALPGALRTLDERLPVHRLQKRSRADRYGSVVRYGMVAAIAMAAGAAVAYLFDARLGRRRRAIVRDKIVRFGRRGRLRVRRSARRVNARSRGMRSRMMHRSIANPFVDDRTLEDRVQSMIFRDARAARGAVSVQVVEGVVELRGALDGIADIQQIEHAASRVPGVRDVRSYLHLVGTDAPNKTDALEAVGLILRDRTIRRKK